MGVHGLGLRCPWCNKNNNLHDNLDRTEFCAPSDGAFSVCASCHGVAVFTGEGTRLGLRKPTLGEARGMLADREFLSLVQKAAATPARQRVMQRVWQ